MNKLCSILQHISQDLIGLIEKPCCQLKRILINSNLLILYVFLSKLFKIKIFYLGIYVGEELRILDDTFFNRLEEEMH